MAFDGLSFLIVCADGGSTRGADSFTIVVMRHLTQSWVGMMVVLTSTLAVSGCGGGGSAVQQPLGATKPARLVPQVQKPSAAQIALRLRQRQATLRVARARLVLAQRKAVAVEAENSLTSFSNPDVSFSYPSSWSVSSARASGSSDVTVRDSDGTHLIRVDMSDAAASTDPEVLAAPVEKGLEGQMGYRLIGWSRTNFDGYDSLQWEFVVREQGTLLRKIDTFFADNNGAGVAILVQAPAAGYQFWTPLFNEVRQSLVADGPASSGTAPQPVAPPSAAPSETGSFCDSHPCIANFDEGSGYIVQCADGTWSQSGGLSGACSYHVGETGNTDGGSDSSGSSGYAPAPTIGSGNSYAVTCADGTISDSGGIQGACSYHGGVSP
jgi:hypothetical protein